MQDCVEAQCASQVHQDYVEALCVRSVMPYGAAWLRWVHHDCVEALCASASRLCRGSVCKMSASRLCRGSVCKMSASRLHRDFVCEIKVMPCGAVWLRQVERIRLLEPITAQINS